VVSQFLIVEDQLADSVRQLLPLPLTFLPAGHVLLTFRDGFPYGPYCISRRAELMRRNVRYGHCLPGGQRGKPGSIRQSFPGRIRNESSIVGLPHGDLTFYPCSRQCNCLSWPLIIGIGFFEEVKHMRRAVSSPQGQQVMMFVR
jgi:hypothetical protein